VRQLRHWGWRIAANDPPQQVLLHAVLLLKRAAQRAFQTELRHGLAKVEKQYGC
jgi:hypothetical protein